MDPNEFLDGGGIPSAKFVNLNDVIRGPITGLTVNQQTEFQTRKPLTWPNGDPMMQLVITLQTNERDPQITDDDGQRRFYVDNKRKREAIGAAVKASGAKIAEGGMLAIQFTGEEASTAGLSPAKLYRAQYQPPTGEQAANDLLGSGTPASTPEPAMATANGAPAQPAPPVDDLL